MMSTVLYFAAVLPSAGSDWAQTNNLTDIRDEDFSYQLF